MESINKNNVYLIGTESCGFCKIILQFLNDICNGEFNIKFYNITDEKNYMYMIENKFKKQINVPAIYVHNGEKYIRLNNTTLINDALIYKSYRKRNYF